MAKVLDYIFDGSWVNLPDKLDLFDRLFLYSGGEKAIKVVENEFQGPNSYCPKSYRFDEFNYDHG